MSDISFINDDDIFVRGLPLSAQLIGRVTFTEMFLLELDGALPEARRVRMIDAILVSLAEHGITPSTLAARLVLDGAPEAVQGAVAAGLLSLGSRFLGTIEQVAILLDSAVRRENVSIEESISAEVRRILARGERIPGLGHVQHKRGDPRVQSLARVAAEEGFLNAHSSALSQLRDSASLALGRELVVNAAGLIGGVLLDMGYAPEQTRGFAVVARAAGLVAHIAEERERPIARRAWLQAAQESPSEQLNSESGERGE